jgi:DNA polymerase III epsilon subunit-like protein
MDHLDRREAIRAAKELLEARPVYLDTETTGLDASSEVVEICVLDHDGRSLVNQLVRPSIPIPSDASRIHGITEVMVATEPTWDEVWPAVARAISGRRVAVYNAEYDVMVMRQSHRKHGLVWPAPLGQFTCLMKLYARYHGEWNSARHSYRWQSLDQAARQCGIVAGQRHRAYEDTLLARAVLEHMAAQGD